MAKILANSGQLVGHSGQVLNADAADCCCGPDEPPPPPQCQPCNVSDLRCDEEQYLCPGMPVPGTVHAKQQRCWNATIDTAADPALVPLVGRIIPCRSVISPFESIFVNGTPYWIQGVWVSATFQIQNFVYRVSFSISSASAVSAPDCPIQLGCVSYTGANSRVNAIIEVTPYSVTTQYACPPLPGNPTGPTQQFGGQLIIRPTNPCGPETIVYPQFTLTASSPMGGDTGIVIGTCDEEPPPPPPPDPIGACCREGLCSERTQSQCISSGGVWYGAGSLCADIQCATPPDPLGACCLPNNLCMNMTGAQCQLHGGQWHPPPATCANTICQFGESQSRGVGDTIEKLLRRTGLGYLAKKVLGPNCGCNNRRNRLNRAWPYNRNKRGR